MLSAQAKQELEALRFADPEHLLKAEDVVSTARQPGSALHPHFEWDDGVASHQYRLQQARVLIRTVYVLNAQDLQQVPKTVYVSLHTDQKRPGGGYRAVDEVLADDVLREEWRQTALWELQAWIFRWQRCDALVSAVARAVHPPSTSTGTAAPPAPGRRRRRAS